MKILIVEDETMLADSIKILLNKHGYDADAVYDGESAVAYALLGIYDLIILDILLPNLNGYEVTRQLRSKHIGTPILMLTARSETEDRITGLQSGADYYLTKPFDARELLACIQTLLRRQGNQVDEIRYGNTSLILSAAQLRCGEHAVRLSAKEFEIMRCLMQRKNQILTKEIILEKVWGFDSDAVENHVEVYMGFLRKKLSSIGSDIRIKALRKLGYCLEVNEHDQAAAH